MNGLVIFWVNEENFRGVILRDKNKTIEEQIKDFTVKTSGTENIANLFAKEIWIEEK